MASIKLGNVGSTAFAAAIWLAGASVSHAQGMIAGAIGNTMSQIAADEERACRQGAPALPVMARILTRQATGLMDNYARLRGGEDRKALSRLFALHSPDISLKTPEGPEGIEAAKAFFAASGPAEPGRDGAAPKLVSMIIAGDARTASSLWETAGGDHYFVTMIDQRIFLNGGYRIERLRLIPAGEALPALPAQYCHKVGDVKAAD